MRNTFLSISSILILTLLILFIDILVVLQDVSFRIIDSINERMTISLYLKNDYDKNSIEVIDLQKDIKKAIPEVVTTYKTKDELLDEIRERDPDLVSIIERQNPLPETITIENIPLQQYEILNTLIENKLFILTDGINESQQDEYFSNYTQQFERIQQVTTLLKNLQIGLWIVIITVIISIGIIIYSVIGNFIYYYKNEIYITRLVWGSNIFIYGPFMVQGMIYVAISFILSTILFLMLLYNVSSLFDTQDISAVYRWEIAPVLAAEAILFLLIGALSGFFSSRRYLKQ